MITSSTKDGITLLQLIAYQDGQSKVASKQPMVTLDPKVYATLSDHFFQPSEYRSKSPVMVALNLLHSKPKIFYNVGEFATEFLLPTFHRPMAELWPLNPQNGF